MRKFSKAVLFLAVSMLISSCEKNGIISPRFRHKKEKIPNLC